MTNNDFSVDVLVVGGGISGLQASLDLADQGFQVAVVEKEPSIGGKMIALSKVFPTLDCSSCITTPKMAASAHHSNIRILTYTELKGIEGEPGAFRARVLKKPRYVDEENCIGCRQCEYACPISVPHSFEGGFGTRRAAYVPFTNAIPQLALLDMDNCVLCGKCEKVCPANAIDFSQRPEEITISARSVVAATGFELTPPTAKPQYGYDSVPNVVTGLQMERLLAPHGPYGRVLRPSDGKMPESIAYVQCAGSRDASLGVPYCSRVCCMYAIKQAMLLSGALPLADITIYYMDIRAFGKGYEQFYQNAQAMGIEFVKGKVARITEGENQSPIVRVEMIEDGGMVRERQHDLVVLSTGMLPGWHPEGIEGLTVAQDGFLRLPSAKLRPARTDREGVFVAGTAAGPKDIVDSIVEGGAAAMEASNFLRGLDAVGNGREAAGGVAATDPARPNGTGHADVRETVAAGGRTNG
ncbi:MAG TPA: CoB--CoM heterodisulfide reductase iron-sulfur subunit A family protein [Chloroflexota bacterium]|nr:CoB--CoM heterodisulfide reductase iron-sulfur subunit A family protein [Chloroflexota bacterium]